MAESVRLEAMSADRFATWGRESQAGFIDQQVASGSMPAHEAGAYAQREFAKLLPAGLDSPGHHLWCAHDRDVEVGTLWVGLQGRAAGLDSYVYDLSVAPDLRRRGYGRAIMIAGEAEARRRGASSMRLNVFGHNTGAYRLYRSLGYGVTSTSMTRRLETSLQPERLDEPMLRLERTQPGSPEHHVWTAYDGGLEVTTIWLCFTTKSDGVHAFGDDFIAHEGLRRHGYGGAVIAAVERICRDRGVVSVGTILLGSNAAVRAVYDQAGFRVAARLMEKSL